MQHGLLPPGELEPALARRQGRDLARLLLEEGSVPRYAIETILALGGSGLTPLAAPDWRAATTRGAAGPGVGSSELGSWPSEAFAPGEARASLLAPRGRLGRFELLEELGHGGGGWVFRARDDRDGREVALKVLRRASDVAVQRFLREATAVARLRHPHIVALLERGEDDARHWLAFDLVAGRPLQERCEEPDWTPARAAAVLRDAARALQHAHEQGVLHRDMKPSNVLVDEEGRGRVLDFGLARLEDEASPLTSSGAVLGTVRYMAPEQAFPGSRPLDPRTDVWGLGATLYHALTRKPPYPRGPLPGEELRRPRALDPQLPAPLERIVLRCLQDDPAARYPSAGELAEDLERFLRGERVRAPGPRGGRLARLVGAAAMLLALALAGSPGPGAAAPAMPAVVSSAATPEELREVERLLRAASDASSEEELLAAAEALGRLAASPRARALLVTRLEEMTTRLRLLGRDLLLQAEEPDPVEMACGEAPLRGLRESIERTREGLTLQAQLRLESRVSRETPAVARGPTPLLRAMAAHYAQRLGPQGARVLRALVLALRRVADPGLVPPLSRYLDAEPDELRAIPAAQALVRTGTAPALRTVLEALRRFGPSSRFAQEAVRGVESAERTWIDPSNWAELTARGDLSLMAEDLPGALRDYRRAAALAPTVSLLWNRQALVWQRLGRKEPARACYDLALACEPASAEARLNRARLLRDLGDLDGAEADARAAVDQPAYRVSALTELAMIRNARGDVAESLRLCDQALALDPRGAPAWNERGNAHRAQGRLDAAEEDFTRAIELEPLASAPWRNRALLRSQRGDRPGARSDATRALELAPRDPDAWICRGDIRREGGDLEGALGDYAHAAELDARSASAWDGRGLVLRQRREWEEALRAHDRALELDPERAASWLNRAGTLQEAGHLQRARSDLDRALELDPRNAVAWCNRSGLRRLGGDLAGAVSDADEALRLSPDYTLALLNRALARLDAKDPRRARADLDRILAIQPGWAAAWGHRGKLRYEAGELPEAEADFSRAIDLDPLSPLSWLNRGGIRHRLGREREALADLNRALELDPREADAWANRGLVHRALGDLPRAQADLTRALELDPLGVPHLRNRAFVRTQAGDLTGAEADLTRAVELAPGDAEAWQARASVRIERGDLDGAEADLARLLEVAPGRALAVRALRGKVAALRAKQSP